MKQSRLQSFMESIANVAVGFVLSFLTNLIVMPWFGMHPSASDSFWITVIFTVILLARSFALRRAFEAITTRTAA
ncbi:MAG: hypothetical protein KDK08_05885 [Rhizobiaceae bacterium]|nr:hypothetical protein [Rhizobiaceae bacterium]MCC0000990.1 hypothetical protein [Methylobacteriaceae bacterium]